MQAISRRTQVARWSSLEDRVPVYARAADVDLVVVRYDSEISVLDYPILDPAKRLHFGVSPMFKYSYALPNSRYVIGYKVKPFRPFFEYIGEM